jgi:hypothetical protein
MNYNIQSITDTKNSFPKNTRFVFEDFLIACPFSLNYLKQVSRKREIMQWRQLGMVWLAIENMHLSKAGRFFDKDHSTVIHALKVVRSANKGYDYMLKEKIDAIMNCIELSVPYSEDSSENEKNSLMYLERLIKIKLAAEGKL